MIGQQIGPERLDRYFSLPELEWPVVTVTYLERPVMLALIHGTIAEGLVDAAELPTPYDGATVTGRECDDGEADVVALRIGDDWVEARRSLYADIQPGETYADIVERLRLDETSLFPPNSRGV